MLIGWVALHNGDTKPRLSDGQVKSRAAAMQPAADDDNIVFHRPAPLVPRCLAHHKHEKGQCP